MQNSVLHSNYWFSNSSHLPTLPY